MGPSCCKFKGMVRRVGSASLLASWISCVVAGGCGPAGGPSGPVVKPGVELPGVLAALLPAGSTLLHSESTDAPTEYRLWLFRGPGPRLVALPEDVKGLEKHDLPGAVLDGLLGSRCPRLDRGDLRRVTCRFAHWSRDGVEYQVREALTDQGWFASLEQLPQMK